jgi:hypothetical protein
MDLKKDKNNQRSSESQNENKTSEELSKLFVRREQSYEDEENIEAWGVYMRKGSEEILFGIFWDKEIANFVVNCIRDSPLLSKVKNATKE